MRPAEILAAEAEAHALVSGADPELVAALEAGADALAREEDAAGAEPLEIRRQPPLALVLSGWMPPADLARRLRATARALEAEPPARPACWP